MGYKLSAEEISPDEGKSQSLEGVEKTGKYYRSEIIRWIMQLLSSICKGLFPAGIAKQRNEIMKKNRRFTWTPHCEADSHNPKTAMIESMVLSHPENNSPFVLDTDASDNSLGAVLSNGIDCVEYPVAFTSRVLSPVEFKYSTTKLLVLAVIQAMK